MKESTKDNIKLAVIWVFIVAWLAGLGVATWAIATYEDHKHQDILSVTIDGSMKIYVGSESSSFVATSASPFTFKNPADYIRGSKPNPDANNEESKNIVKEVINQSGWWELQNSESDVSVTITSDQPTDYIIDGVQDEGSDYAGLWLIGIVVGCLVTMGVASVLGY